jgi:MFS family permease
MTEQTETSVPWRGTTRRNVLLLAVCQSLSATTMSLIITVHALAGFMLAEDKTLATLPLGIMFTMVMFSTIPASLFMKRYGRRLGFTLGQSIGTIAAIISVYAIFKEDFWLFALGGAFLGTHTAFWQYYRFAAADTASAAYRSRAISYVLAGGVISAILGPELAKYSRELFAPVVFAGNFVVMAILCLITIIVLQFVTIPPPTDEDRTSVGRPLSKIVSQPKFITAVLAAMCGYGVMVLVMTTTPLAVLGNEHSFNDAAFIIQWHILGMFVPSFFTGHLIKRFGVLPIIVSGALLMAICVAVNMTGVGIAQFWVALVALGVGWNFMFVGGTTMLTETYERSERAKMQATNDFLVFGTVAVASLSSGVLFNTIGWQGVNLAVVVPIVLILTVTIWFRVAHAEIAPAE